MGMLNLGDQSIARITQPHSQSLFSPGSQIEIIGSAIFATGSYTVRYGEGESPGSWQTIDSGTTPVYDDLLATWDTTGLDAPTYVIKLDVNNGQGTFSDLVTVNLLVDEEPPAPESGVIYTYDNLDRLKKVTYPDGSMVEFTYDDVGNRQQRKITEGGGFQAAGEQKSVAPEVNLFEASPTPAGIVLTWTAKNENKLLGYNLYRTQQGRKTYTRINTETISPGSSEYTFTDVPPKVGGRWSYLLEQVKTSGDKKTYGPVKAKNISLKNATGDGVFKKSFKAKCN
jgi:YD repeat-containing protein